MKTQVIVIGAGAAGLMCAISAAKRGRQVVVLDHANKAGKKILMSGGGRCNFTNYYIEPEKYISHNPHFCKSALSRYTQWDFIELVERYQIPYHEKTLGQLFCDGKSKDIVDMLLCECDQLGVEVLLKTKVNKVKQMPEGGFTLKTSLGDYLCESLVVASGGLSIPTMGASAFGYELARQFSLKVWPLRAGLVPFTLQPEDKSKYEVLSGVSASSVVSNDKQSFDENILFTHRGMSGPAVLQISSYWQPGEAVNINLLPKINLNEFLNSSKQEGILQQVNTLLSNYLPKRLLEVILPEQVSAKSVKSLNEKEINLIANCLQQFKVKPGGTEGYRTAEVTLGGVDCDQISSKTFETKEVKGLYFIGEVLDVTGWLGGYNFQWAWASGWCAGLYV